MKFSLGAVVCGCEPLRVMINGASAVPGVVCARTKALSNMPAIVAGMNFMDEPPSLIVAASAPGGRVPPGSATTGAARRHRSVRRGYLHLPCRTRNPPHQCLAQTAIDEDVLSIDIAGPVTCEERDYAGEIRRLGDPTCGD